MHYEIIYGREIIEIDISIKNKLIRLGRTFFVSFVRKSDKTERTELGNVL